MRQLQMDFEVKYPPTYRVVHRDGRYYVVRPVAGTKNIYDIIENCRTLAFANEVCAALNEGKRKHYEC